MSAYRSAQAQAHELQVQGVLFPGPGIHHPEVGHREIQMATLSMGRPPIFISQDGEMVSRQCAENPVLIPCSFEYVYLARPDSIMNGISVYEARLRLGDRLADTVAKYAPAGDIDVVMPIPDSSRPAAMQVARKLGIEYREGYYKNRYVGRTFIMPGQEARRKLFQ